MPEITISYDAAPDEPYPYEAIAAISRVVGQHLPVSELTWTRRYDDTPEQDGGQAEGVQAAPTQTPAGRCSHCQHPINDHSHRRDQKVYADQRRPWCHACNARCDYEQAEGGL